MDSSAAISYATTAVVATVVFMLMRFFFKHRSKSPLPPNTIYPPHLSSWIPFIGSAMELQKGLVRDFILKTARRLRAPAFTATIMGDKCLFIADSSLLPVMFRESKQIDGLSFQKRFLRNVIGFDEPQTQVLFGNHGSNPTPAVIMKLFQKYLLKDDALEKVMKVTQGVLLKEIDQRFGSNTDWKESHLMEFCSKTIFRASAGPLVSMKINDGAEEHLRTLRTFEQGLGKLFIGTPKALVSEASQARSDLIDLLDSNLIKDSESDFMKERRKELINGFGQEPAFKDTNINTVVAANNLGVLLATVGNSIQAIFWTLLNLMEDPNNAYDACRQDVLKVIKQRNQCEADRDYFTLKELDQLPVLQSAFEETLRLHQFLFVTRRATTDFVLNPKEPEGERPKYMVEKGTLIMAFPNTMHMDPLIFENPHRFQYDRFKESDATSKLGTKLSTHLRPFGGGAHLCPGRKFIGYEARALLAMLLWKFEMKLSPKESKPNVDLTRQGMSVCVPERDVKFQIRKHPS